MKEYKGFRVGEKVLIKRNLMNEYIIKDRSGTSCTLNVQGSQKELEGEICTIKSFNKFWCERLNQPIFYVEENMWPGLV